MDHRKASREQIARWVREIEERFELTAHHREIKRMFGLSLADFRAYGKCVWCGTKDVEGHVYEECVVRLHGTLEHCYQKRTLPSMSESSG